jgi:hypothetical protein
MVTGQKAFQGKSYSTLVGAILATDPTPMSVKAFTPSWLERLVRRCLAKDPEDRWQSMRDVVIELKTPPELENAAPSEPRFGRALWLVAGIATLALIVAIVAGAGWYSATRPAPLRPLIRLNVDTGVHTPLARARIGPNVANMLALSPDGARLALNAARRGRQSTPLHQTAESEPGHATVGHGQRRVPVLFSR